jgi:hypothetical protein
VENPPPVFYFSNETLPLEELERVARIWNANPAHAHHARNTEVLLAIRRKAFRTLRSLARSFQGRDYLFIPKAMDWPDARKFCEALGGHLLTLTSPEEEAFVMELYALKATWMWLGLVVSQGRPVWISGESSAFTRMAETPTTTDGYCFVAHAAWHVDTTRIHPPHLHFIVEWPK